MKKVLFLFLLIGFQNVFSMDRHASTLRLSYDETIDLCDAFENIVALNETQYNYVDELLNHEARRDLESIFLDNRVIITNPESIKRLSNVVDSNGKPKEKVVGAMNKYLGMNARNV